MYLYSCTHIATVGVKGLSSAAGREVSDYRLPRVARNYLGVANKSGDGENETYLDKDHFSQGTHQAQPIHHRPSPSPCCGEFWQDAASETHRTGKHHNTQSW